MNIVQQETEKASKAIGNEVANEITSEENEIAKCREIHEQAMKCARSWLYELRRLELYVPPCSPEVERRLYAEQVEACHWALDCYQERLVELSSYCRSQMISQHMHELLSDAEKLQVYAECDSKLQNFNSLLEEHNVKLCEFDKAYLKSSIWYRKLGRKILKRLLIEPHL